MGGEKANRDNETDLSDNEANLADTVGSIETQKQTKEHIGKEALQIIKGETLGTLSTEPKRPHDKPKQKDIDSQIWDAILSLSKEHIDGFPFTAKMIADRIGIHTSMITRERHGLTNMLTSRRDELITALRFLVTKEEENIGKIGIKFCWDIGFVLVTHHEIISHDIIAESHRNIRLVLGELKPLIVDQKFHYFVADFYVLFEEWDKEGFTRGSVTDKYASRMQGLFHTYQKVRPDMNVTSSRLNRKTAENDKETSRETTDHTYDKWTRARGEV